MLHFRMKSHNRGKERNDGQRLATSLLFEIAPKHPAITNSFLCTHARALAAIARNDYKKLADVSRCSRTSALSRTHQ